MSHACIYICAMHIIHLKHACSEASIAMDVTEHDNAICKLQHAIIWFTSLQVHILQSMAV